MRGSRVPRLRRCDKSVPSADYLEYGGSTPLSTASVQVSASR